MWNNKTTNKERFKSRLFALNLTLGNSVYRLDSYVNKILKVRKYTVLEINPLSVNIRDETLKYIDKDFKIIETATRTEIISYKYIHSFHSCVASIQIAVEKGLKYVNYDIESLTADFEAYENSNNLNRTEAIEKQRLFEDILRTFTPDEPEMNTEIEDIKKKL